jgi:uncharacterized protein (UPF0333 family)
MCKKFEKYFNIQNLKSTGQLSLELLIITSIFLILIGVSVFSLERLTSKSKEKIEIEKSKADFEALCSMINSACVLGQGNLRTIEFVGQVPEIKSYANVLEFKSSNFQGKKEFRCDILVLSVGKKIKLENSDGKIIIDQKAN